MEPNNPNPTTVTTTLQQPQQTSQPTQNTEKLPWPTWSLWLIAILFGPVGGFLVTWKNVERFGQTEEANRFFKKGGIICLIAVLAYMIIYPTFIQADVLKYLAQAIGLMYPVWFQFQFLKTFPAPTSVKTKVDLALFGWGVLGMIIVVVAAFLVDYVLGMLLG